MITTRPMTYRDIISVVEIEKQSFPVPWTLEEFIQLGKRRSVVRLVAEWDNVVMGYLIYEVYQQHLEILNIAVGEGARRLGVGTSLMGRLTAKLSPERKSRAALKISDTNLPGQLFFKANGFRAVNILRDHFSDGASAYLMQYQNDGTVVPIGRRHQVSGLVDGLRKPIIKS